MSRAGPPGPVLPQIDTPKKPTRASAADRGVRPTCAGVVRFCFHPLMVAALGLRAHSGWAVIIAVANGSAILRRRIEMSRGPGDPAKQPYHAAQGMELPQAGELLRRTEKIAVAMAATALKDAIATLTAEGFEVEGAAVLLGSGKPLPELMRILAAHPLIHKAEGVFFRDVLTRACEECGLAVAGIREGEVMERCAVAMRIPAVDLPARLSAMGKTLGPPWTQDEKLSTAAALAISRWKLPPR